MFAVAGIVTLLVFSIYFACKKKPWIAVIFTCALMIFTYIVAHTTYTSHLAGVTRFEHATPWFQSDFSIFFRLFWAFLALFATKKMIFGALISTVFVCSRAVYDQNCGQKTLSPNLLHAENIWSTQGRAFLCLIVS